MTLPRIFTSSKFQAAFGATIIALVPLYFTLSNPSIDRATKQADTQSFVHNLLIIWSVAIGATGLEDAADKHKPAPAAPPAPVQVNTADSQTITAAPAAPAAAAQPNPFAQFTTQPAKAGPIQPPQYITVQQ